MPAARLKPAPAAPARAEPARLELLPGQWYVGRGEVTLSTLLGSCVAITLWHAALRVGGMCHYLLPSRRHLPGRAGEGRFGEEAIAMMVERFEQAGARPDQCVAHIYGGADTLPELNGTKLNIGQRNIEAGWHLIDHYGFSLEGVDVGDDVPRTVTCSLATGEVAVRRGAPCRAVTSRRSFQA